MPSDVSRPSKRRRVAKDAMWAYDLAELKAAGPFFRTRQSAETKNFQVTSTPFPACVLPGLFDEDFLKSVKKQLQGVEYFERSSDLFQFSGSHDLATLDDATPVGRLRQAIYSNEFLAVLEGVTGIALTRQVDMSSHIYKRGDFLACHSDDIVETDDARRIAFIIYLVDGHWNAEDGGQLGLFSSDSDGNPAKITTRISPQWNSVAFFEATPTSFHEVGEVFKADEGRLSISGWFHGRLDTRMALRNFVDKPAPAELSQSSFTIVAEQYTKAEQVQRLREEFAQSSTLTVTDFLSPKALASVQREDLNSADKFQKDPIGPASVRRFHVPPAGSSLARILEDPSMIAWLEKITSTTIRKQRTTVRLFKQGCYQIIHDQALDPVGLDVVLSLGNGTKEPWDKKHGGRLAYTAAADDDSSTSMASDAGATLFEAWPEFNTLTIVLRDEGVLKSVGWVKQGVAGLGGRVDAEAVYLLEPQEVESDQEGDVPTDGDNLEEEFTGINSD